MWAKFQQVEKVNVNGQEWKSLGETEDEKLLDILLFMCQTSRGD